MMGMTGMLDCAGNYEHKYRTKLCNTCKVLDDESHRINNCSRFKESNLYSSQVKFDFDHIYSEDDEKLDRAAQVIMELWDIVNGRNSMQN